jgi:hypothetical protein
MIVSDEKKFVYFHSAKTGGSSVTHAIAPWSNLGPKTHGSGHGWQPKYHYGGMHNTVAQSWATHGQQKWMDYFWFSFVRNPFDLVISAWRAAQGIYADPAPSQRRRFLNADIEFGMTNLSLEQYLENELGDDRLLHIRRTQTENLITGAPGAMNFIGRFETLNEDWAKIAKELKIDALLPHRNKSEREPGYKQYYTPEARAIVEKFYKEDLVNFNYEY